MALPPTTQRPAPRTLRSDLTRLRQALAAFVSGRRPRRLLGRLHRSARISGTGRRVLVLAVASFLPVAIIAVLTGSALTRTATSTARVGDTVRDRIGPVLDLADELAEATVLLDRFYASGSLADGAAFEAHARRVDQGFAPLLDERMGPPAAQRRLRTAWDSWSFVRDTITSSDFALPDDPGSRRASLATLSTTLVSVRRDLAEVTDAATADVVRAAEDAEGTAGRMRFLVTGGLGVAAVLGVALVTWLLTDLRRGARTLVAAAERLREGHLDERIPGDVPRDLAPVARAFNEMADRLEHQRSELRGMAANDGLTGALNRRGFEDELHAELERSHRYGHTLALLLLDIDHFKQVNDTHGHQVGDRVLWTVAAGVCSTVRGVDRVGRWGGEEFAVLLPETATAAAQQVAERVRGLVAGAAVDTEGGRVAVTVSIGVAVADPGAEAPSTSELVARADRALYQAKESGRDRVVVAPG